MFVRSAALQGLRGSHDLEALEVLFVEVRRVAAKLAKESADPEGEDLLLRTPGGGKDLQGAFKAREVAAEGAVPSDVDLLLTISH